MRNPSLTPSPTPPGVGSPAHDFALLTQDKGEWRLSEQVRKGDVVLCFFPFAFTGTCSVEMKCISSEIAAWQAKGAQVVGISCDSHHVNKAWAQREGYTHVILSDLHREVCKAYGFYWADLNVASRGTVVIAKDPQGQGKIKFVQARPPGEAMEWEQIAAQI